LCSDAEILLHALHLLNLSSDTCCYPSRHSYGIWLSVVPNGLHDLSVFWNYTVGLNKCASLLATFHLDIYFRCLMIDMQRQFNSN
jgi:hypothetical protein